MKLTNRDKLIFDKMKKQIKSEIESFHYPSNFSDGIYYKLRIEEGFFELYELEEFPSWWGIKIHLDKITLEGVYEGKQKLDDKGYKLKTHKINMPLFLVDLYTREVYVDKGDIKKCRKVDRGIFDAMLDFPEVYRTHSGVFIRSYAGALISLVKNSP